MAGNPQQQALIPLTDEEIRARGRILARLTLELRDLRADHTEQKKAMRAAEEEIERRLGKIARAIRDGGDEPE